MFHSRLPSVLRERFSRFQFGTHFVNREFRLQKAGEMMSEQFKVFDLDRLILIRNNELQTTQYLL